MLAEQIVGALLVMAILLDVFLTVLYARICTGIISDRLSRLTWRCFMALSRPFGKLRGDILSFCGPVILLLLIVTWIMGLTCGTALILHPKLGTSIRASSGNTPTNFLTAMYAGSGSLMIAGTSDFAPQTSPFRLFFLWNSLVGLSVLSLTLTYLMQIYTALQRRNVLGLQLNVMTAGTGDAAELIVGLGPRGDFDSARSILAELAHNMADAKESHHFYPILFYFRFHEPCYSVSMITMTALDTFSLLKCALDTEQYGALQQSSSVSQLWDMSMLWITTLENTFLPGGVAKPAPPSTEAIERWSHRYFAAVERFKKAGIKTPTDQNARAQDYIILRTRWDNLVTKLAPSLGYSMEEIDPAGASFNTS